MWLGLAAVESTVPSESKSHAYVSVVFSGSEEPSLENWTVSGARPAVGVPVACAIGAFSPEM